MAEVSKVLTKPLLRALEKLERESRRKNNGDVIVGYAASYALFVHENLDAAHGEEFNKKHGRGRGPNQQAKFLETPFRTMKNSGILMSTITTAVKNGVPLPKALKIAGLDVQRASQLIVPVDTGNLKGSAFTEME
jgi:hypothetical protein